jgi:hypothetical protein
MVANMKLYLDDLRPTPEGWTQAYTAPEAIKILETGQVVVLSLDHDLGEPESEVGTGYTVITWLEEKAAFGEWAVVPEKIVVHSANPVGIAKMNAAIASIARMRERAGRGGEDSSK